MNKKRKTKMVNNPRKLVCVCANAKTHVILSIYASMNSRSVWVEKKIIIENIKNESKQNQEKFTAFFFRSLTLDGWVWVWFGIKGLCHFVVTATITCTSLFEFLCSMVEQVSKEHNDFSSKGKHDSLSDILYKRARDHCRDCRSAIVNVHKFCSCIREYV